MSYDIALRTFQTNTNAFFHPIEFTNWSGTKDNWSINASGNQASHLLHMGYSGGSGGIRFSSPDNDEQFIVYVGVHNWVRWCDIVGNPSTSATALHAKYYQSGTPQTAARERTQAWCTGKTKRGRTVNLTYTVARGNNLLADIVIG